MTFGRVAILAAAIAVALPGAALAAGPTYDWTGVYIGAQAGGGWSNTATGETHMYNAVDPLEEYEFSPLAPFSFSGSGMIGGGEAGFNWQSPGGLVFGAVGDISAANIRGTYTDSDAAFTVDSTINWLSTLRVNLGMPMGNMLLYGTGGLAVGGVTAGLHDSYDDGATIIDSSNSTTQIGWTAGAGIAAAINKNWILKGEYLYVDLGTQQNTFSEPDPGFPLITSSGKTTANIFRVSLDYKF